MAHELACWITKAINTHTEYAILIAFPLQKLLDEIASIFLHTYMACLVEMVSVKPVDRSKH